MKECNETVLLSILANAKVNYEENLVHVIKTPIYLSPRRAKFNVPLLSHAV
jgi:hypothetical protein